MPHNGVTRARMQASFTCPNSAFHGSVVCVCVCVCVCVERNLESICSVQLLSLYVRFDQHVAHQTLHIIRRHHVHTMQRYRCAFVGHNSIQYTVVKVKNLG